MSRYKIEELCFDLGDSANAVKFKEDPDGFIGRYPLMEAEKEAIKKGDIGALYKMGVLTQAILNLSGGSRQVVRDKSEF